MSKNALSALQAHIEHAERQRDELQLELEAAKHNHRRDNEYLCRQRDELRGAVKGLVKALLPPAAS